MYLHSLHPLEQPKPVAEEYRDGVECIFLSDDEKVEYYDEPA
jgi:hypothetical protein